MLPVIVAVVLGNVGSFEECPNFTGEWKGRCSRVSDPDKVIPSAILTRDMTLSVVQRDCSRVVVNGGDMRVGQSTESFSDFGDVGTITQIKSVVFGGENQRELIATYSDISVNLIQGKKIVTPGFRRETFTLKDGALRLKHEMADMNDPFGKKVGSAECVYSKE